MDAVQLTKKRKEFIGIVKSDRMQKTAVVEVKTLVRHPQYGKTIARKERFKAHDEKNEAHIGDRVLIRETRPMSKDKRWRIVQIISRAAIAAEQTNDL